MDLTGLSRKNQFRQKLYGATIDRSKDQNLAADLTADLPDFAFAETAEAVSVNNIAPDADAGRPPLPTGPMPEEHSTLTRDALREASRLLFGEEDF